MSVLPPDLYNALGLLLQALSSSDNATRSQAEEQLQTDWVVNRPEVLLMGLVEHMQGAGEPTMRTFAAVLFRRIATKNRKDPVKKETRELFMTLQLAQKTAIRQRLLESLATESLPQVRNKISDAVAEIARQYTDEGEIWPELLGALFNASQSPDASRREGAFRIFATTPGIIEKQHEDNVLAVFTKGFKDDDITVRLSAMEAFAAFFRSITKKVQVKYYALIPEVLNILPPMKDAQHSEELRKALIALVDLAEVAPKMFRPLFHNLVTFSISVIQDKELGDQARQIALELMASFAEYAPQMCRKDPSYISEMVTQCLSLMTDIGMDDEDASDWNASEDLDVEESDLNHVAGEQCMDRLAQKLGGQTVLPPTFSWLPRMMTSSAWRDRHAALMAISAISEGCRELMTGELDKVLELVVPALRDPHPRVRWAGCNALGQMSTDFARIMQEKYHQIVLENIIPVLESTEPRVQSHAAAALVNFCEEAEKEILEPYLDNLLSRLLVLLQSPKRFVQEQALSTIATIADSAEAAFGRFYDTLMPLLFNVLQGEHSKDYRLLRAKAMECATLIALAVGQRRLGQDATTLVGILGNIQQNITDSDDPQGPYLLHCWGRMCRVLGQDFVPYLPGVMPPLIEMGSSNADIQLLEDEEQVAQIEQDEGWEIVPVKGKVIGIKTASLDDKHMAIELIMVYAQVLDAAFEPYVLRIMETCALPGLIFYFHDPVRVASAKCIPQLLNSYKKAHGDQSPQLRELWLTTVNKLLEALSAEPSIETLAEMYQCFYESVESLGKCLDQAHQLAFVQNVEEGLKEYQERVKARLQDSAENEDGEEMDEDTLMAIEDDQTLLSDMNKAFHVVFKYHSPEFLASWEQLLPYFVAFLTSNDPTQRQWALCVMDDVLEFCGEQSARYQDQFMKPLIDGCRDPNAANRQAAAYGVGVAAHKGGAPWAEFAAAALPVLFEVTQQSHARELDHVFATENACASIAKILHYSPSKVSNFQDVIVHWIDTLPVVYDEEAAPYAYLYLAKLIEQRNPAVTTQAPKVFKFIVQALDAETMQGTTAARVITAGKFLLESAGLNVTQVMGDLSPESQQTIQRSFA